MNMKGFKTDDPFSFHKDLALKFLWKQKSFEGRFVLIKDKHLQKHCGIDVILQGENDKSELLLDNKHRRGDPIGEYGDVLLEELSNSNPDMEKLGWALDPNKRTDLVFYCCWINCASCFGNCKECKKTLVVDVYVFHYKKMRAWFTKNYQEFPSKYTTQLNKTKNRCVPLKIAAESFDFEFIGRYDIQLINFVDWPSIMAKCCGQVLIDDYVLNVGGH